MQQLPFFVNNAVYRNENALFCVKRFEENHNPYVHFIYKDVEGFRNGSVHELYCSKAYQIRKVHTR